MRKKKKTTKIKKKAHYGAPLLGIPTGKEAIQRIAKAFGAVVGLGIKMNQMANETKRVIPKRNCVDCREVGCWLNKRSADLSADEFFNGLERAKKCKDIKGPGIKMGQMVIPIHPDGNKPESILSEAKRITENNDRKYEDMNISFQRIADIASKITGKDLTAEDVIYVLVALKLQRETYKHKRDNLVDIMGYINILNKLKENKHARDNN